MAAEKDNKLNIKTRQILGYFGALPFLFLSIFPLFLEFPEGYIFNLLLAFYGGVILSFLGGMTWGWEGEADNNTSLIFWDSSFIDRVSYNRCIKYVSIF